MNIRVLLSVVLALFCTSMQSHQVESRRRIVRSVHARITGEQPYYSEKYGQWFSAYGNDDIQKHRGYLDSVNTASVEGTLVYLQAERIEADVVKNTFECFRPSIVTFFEVYIAQTEESLDYYHNSDRSPPGHCEYVAFDSGRCNIPGSDEHPIACDEYHGVNGSEDIGPCVGAQVKEVEEALYPGSYWFSFPNDCPMKKWWEKDEKVAGSDQTCREIYPGGLCDIYQMPNGDDPIGDERGCTFQYKVLGFIDLDDVTGIKSMGYQNYTEFCKDEEGEYRGVEYNTTDKNNIQTIPFWSNPFDPKANSARIQKLIDHYQVIQKENDTFEPLPSISHLQKYNPRCRYPLGPRKYYSQICEESSE